MLSAEQSRLVRDRIVEVFGVEAGAVAPEARLFADLGGTVEQLTPLRLAIEADLPVQIDPIANQVTARGAVNPDGRLTKESMAQIVEYLGDWPARPQHPVAFLDLFTVGMIEAMVAKALSVKAAADGTAVASAEKDGALELAPEFVQRVHEVVARVTNRPLETIHSELNLDAGSDDAPLEFVSALMEVQNALGVNLDVELKQMKGWLGEAGMGRATPLTMTRLRRLIPNFDSLPDVEYDPTSTVGLIERLCAAAIERRESPEAARTRKPPRESLGSYLARWSWGDQDWWAGLPPELGTERYRLYLTGMLRAAFLQAGSLDGTINEILEIIENYAETGAKPDKFAQKFRAVSKWKWWRNPLWGGLLCVLKPECTAEDGGGILARVDSTFGWNSTQTLEAARQWLRSIAPPPGVHTTVAAEWCTSDVMELAQRMQKLRTFVEFPKLGTLLEQAGCAEPDILDHCRNPDRRHLRGDWLLAGLFAAAPEEPAGKTRRKAGSAAAKPKKRKLPKMTSRQKKNYKEQLMQFQGGVPVAAAWASAWQADHSRHEESFKEKDASLPKEALKMLGGIYPVRMVVHPDVAVVRRLELGSPVDLHQALALYGRSSLVIWHSFSRYFDLLDRIRDAFAAGDNTAVQWVLRELPQPAVMDADSDYWGYLALRAIAARNDSRMAMLAERWPHPVGSHRIPPIEKVLLPILRRDGTGVATALNEFLAQQRSSEDAEGFGAVSLTAHACHRAAQHLDPALVAGFDVAQEAPWDAEYHSAMQERPDPLADFDLSTTPPLLRELFETQKIPAWLQKLQDARRKREDEVAVVLTDIGPNRDAVFRATSRAQEGWTHKDFDHQSKRLPLTLRTSASRASASFLTNLLEKAGATVKIVELDDVGPRT
jgi:hypothetical protein